MVSKSQQEPALVSEWNSRFFGNLILTVALLLGFLVGSHRPAFLLPGLVRLAERHELRSLDDHHVSGLMEHRSRLFFCTTWSPTDCHMRSQWSVHDCDVANLSRKRSRATEESAFFCNDIDDDDNDDDYDDCRTMQNRSSHGRRRIGRRFAWYSLYAWGMPLVVVVVGQVLDHLPDLSDRVVRPEFGVKKCWFHGNRGRGPLSSY